MSRHTYKSRRNATRRQQVWRCAAVFTGFLVLSHQNVSQTVDNSPATTLNQLSASARAPTLLSFAECNRALTATSTKVQRTLLKSNEENFNADRQKVRAWKSHSKNAAM